MNSSEWREYCLTMPGAREDYPETWAVWRMLAGKKFFALVGAHEGRECISLKCDPVYAMELRDIYPDIIPGYYLNKSHWNTIYTDGSVSEDLIRKLVQDSYTLVRKSLTKKEQQELLA